MSDNKTTAHIPILDGWRALSILLVLAGHWLPIGRPEWRMNESVAASGMALFFCLSGFLITQFLLADQRIGVFLIKRYFRIIPLAWLATIILIVAQSPPTQTAIANLLFYANLPTPQLLEGGGHFWSLFVEIQFYIFMAILVFVGGRRALYLVPIFAICITLLRISDNTTISIVTWYRVDEIFAGGCVALAWNNKTISRYCRALPAFLSPSLLFLLLLVSLPQSGFLGYFRPYAAGLTIFVSLYAFPVHLYKLWTGKVARYIAQISYAVYVFHGMLTATALGGGDVGKIEKYVLRVPLALVTWLLSHISTFYYEKAAIKFGARLVTKISNRSAGNKPVNE